jgi:ATP-dependent protease ClpP protease subunit
LKPAQRAEIQTLQAQMEELKQVNRKILAIAEEHKNKTIEKIMSKSDAELGMEFLLGKLK